MTKKERVEKENFFPEGREGENEEKREREREERRRVEMSEKQEEQQKKGRRMNPKDSSLHKKQLFILH